MNKIFYILMFVICASFIYCEDEDKNSVVVNYLKEENKDMVFYAENKALYPQQLLLNFGEMKNYSGEFEDEYYTVLEPKEKREIFKLTYKGGEAYTEYKYSYFMGDPNVVPDAEKIYLFPFEHNKKWAVTQGYRGKDTHFGESLYAVDFNLDEGSVITAARGGKVVEIKNRGILAYPDPSYLDSGNCIILYHDDGTFAMYAHLQYKGNLVEIGDTVKAGDVIGYSGNTGYSTGPHLHFAVLKPVYCGIVSISTKFLNYDGKFVEVKDGNYYFGYNPAKGEIKGKLGRDLTNEDFKAVKYVRTNNTIEILKETIDEVNVYYCSNGFEKDMDFEFNVDKSENTEFSKELPVKISVKNNSKVFILFTKSIDNKNSSNMLYFYKYKEKNKKNEK